MSSAAGMADPAQSVVARAPEAAAAPRRRLFRKYALLVIALVGAALLINSGFDFWFSYQERKAALVRVQQEKAEAAAQRIGEFVGEIERQIGWTTHAQWAAAPLDQRRQDYFRLLRQVPAITELTELDAQGREQLKVSRLSMDVIGSEADFSQTPAFREAEAHRIWFSPVYFRKQSEPYLTLAVKRDGRSAGVTIAEINLKLIWDVITGLKIGQGGYAYVVDGRGKLIAHPDISLVLRDTDLSRLPQVAAALRPGSRASAATVARNIAGRSVLTAHAAIAPLGWLVFVEVPLREAFAPLYGAALRTGLLLLFGLGAAVLVALLLARRMTGPIRAIAEGAERIGMGDLERRIEVNTGDELEALAGQFNRMAGDLQKSYAELEQRVRDRTAELSEALDQQTATAEVLGVINASPGNLAPVFDAMLEKALNLCEAAFGSLLRFDGEHFHRAAIRNFPPVLASLDRPIPPFPGSALERLTRGEPFAQIEDIAADQVTRAGNPGRVAMAEAGARTTIWVALRKDGKLLGSIVAYRQEVRPFTDKQIALLQNFAAQAVIAMENARLITETREALEQQTATAEVLGVINASPGDLAPVFDAMVDKAIRLCEAACGHLLTYDGQRVTPAAVRGTPEYTDYMRSVGLVSPGIDTPVGRALRGEPVVHIVDAREEEIYRSNEGFREQADMAGFRSMLVVGLRREDAFLGTLTVFRQEVRPFTDKHIALLQNFAAQAVIAMENARLITETREALEQQTATAEVLGVINSSPGDLAPVFDAMLEKALDLCGAAIGILQTYDGRWHTHATRGVPPAYAEFRKNNPPAYSHPGTGPARVLAGDRVVHIVDLKDEDAYRAGEPNRRALVDIGGARTSLLVALAKDAQVLGFIQIYRKEVRQFSDKQIALLENFAAQAVIAMENARLITETREALEQQTATAEVLGVINSSPGDLAPVFDAMLEKALRLCSATLGTLFTFDGEVMRPAAISGASPEYADYLGRAPLRPGAGVLGSFVRGELIQNVADLKDTEAYRAGDSHRRALVDFGGARTMIGVALRRDDRLLGAFLIYRREPSAFSEKQIALLQNFAAQAVIAMENARLITETREALEQQTATAEVLGVINSSPGDLAPVFDAMLEKAMRLCEAAFGVLQLFEGNRTRTVASHGVPAALAAFQQGETHEFGPGTGPARVLAGERVIHFADLKEGEPYRAGDAYRRALVDLGGARTGLVVALVKDDVPLGFFIIYREEVRRFSDKQAGLLQNFAAQAVIAIENARLITETREALEQQTATAEVLGVINSSPGDLAPVFDAILDKAHALCGATQGALTIRDGDAFRAVATHGLPKPFEVVLRQPRRGGAPREALLRGDLYFQIPDMASPGAVGAIMDNPTSRSAVELAGLRTVLFVPLRKDASLLGYITAYRREVRPFSDKQIALLQNFAAQAVIAMENARLITETREALEQQTATAEVLGVINSSPGDLAPVFDAILDKAHSLCGATLGALVIYDGEEFRAAAAHGLPLPLAERLREGFRGADNPVTQPLVDGAPFVHLPDLGKIDHPVPRAAAEIGGVRTGLLVPLCREDTLLGYINAYRQEVRPFSEKQIALLQNFAAQAVIAMENARLITETREALEQQTATAEVLGVINSSPGDLAPVFDAMLRRAMRLCEADFGFFLGHQDGRYALAAARGLKPEFAEYLSRMDQPGPNEANTRVRDGVAFVHIADMKDDEPYRRGAPFRRAMVDIAGGRTGLGVPMRKDGVLLGTFNLARHEVRPFTDKQIALLQNFAAQAVIAMENARLITETREALEQQTATAEVLGVINSSPGDLAPVFDAMLEKAMRLCEASFGIMFSVDGESAGIVAARDVPTELASFLAQHPPGIGPDTFFGRAILQRSVLHTADVRKEPQYREGHPLAVTAADQAGVRALLMAPLIKDDSVLGVFAIFRREVRPFSDKQIALLQNFAAQAVIAMENARLITETREALEQQTATAEVLGVINSSPGDLAPVFEAMLEKALRLCGASFGMMNTYDGERFRRAADYGVPPAYAEFRRRIQPELAYAPDTAPGRILAGEDVIHNDDLKAEEPYKRGDPNRRALVDLGGARSHLAVALRKDGRLLGHLAIYRQELRPFTDKQIALLQNFAAQAVIAMENARLLNETRERTRELQESLEYQTATSDVLKVISQSTFDLQPVLETVAETAARLCDTEIVTILRRQGAGYRVAAAQGWSPEYREFLENHIFAPDDPGTLTGRVVQERRTVQVADVTADPEYTLTESMTLGKARTQLGVPLLREGSPIGVIILSRQRVEPFSQKQIELVTTFADQAVIAIENARLLTETRDRTRDLQESLEYQTATSDVLKVISQSDADLTHVLQTALDTAARLCDAGAGHIFLRRGDRLQVMASHGVSEKNRADMNANLLTVSRGSTTGRAVLTGQIVHIPDIAADPEYAHASTRAEGIRTMLGVPLLRDGVPIGSMSLGRKMVNPFSDKQVQLVATFADQAVIAIENARLLNELRERTDELARSVEELQVLSEVGQAVSSTLDVGAVLSTILNRSVALSGADAGVVFRYSRARQAFRFVEAVGWDDALVERVRGLRVREDETGMGEAAARRAPLQIPDLNARGSYVLRDLTLAAGFRSVLIVPLVGPQRVLGAIVLERRAVGEFPEATMRLMQTLASQSVLAIQNARLFNEIAEKSEQLAEASRHKSQFLANMSHELRTPLNAILGYTELMADGIYGELAPKAAGVLERVQNNGKHLLALINDVLDLSKIEAGQLTLTLEDYALPDVVQSVVSATESLANNKGLKFTADIMPSLPMGHGDARRLAQVLLNLTGNAIKFTDTGEVAIRALAEDGQFVVTVRDTGPGIAPADHGKIFEEFQQVDSSNTRKKGGTGLGLAISKRMVEMQGGTISVQSELGRGATFRVILPIRVESVLEETAELLGAAQ